jgi:hypothetical protein
MRKSMPQLLMMVSTRGSMRLTGAGGTTAVMSSGRPSHCADVENSEALEEGNGLRFLAGFVGALPLAFGHETIGVEDRRSALPLAHMAAESERLTERQPALAGEAVLDHSAPKNENID